MEINLDNPIFVYYFDAKNHPRSYIENTFYNLSEQMNKYTNITFWIVPSDVTKIDCIFDGYKSTKSSLKVLCDCLETIATDPSLREFKVRMRDMLISEIENG
jgi:hypothetical protein